MKIIENLLNEHQNILDFLDDFQNEIINFMENNIFNITSFKEKITFIKEYADKRHHQREEKILFAYMEQYLGEAAKKIIRNGMLIEHDLARYYVLELDKAINAYHSNQQKDLKLKIIGYSFSYIELLRRHIDKENNVVYPFAKRQFPIECWELMELAEKDFFNKK